MANGFGQEGTNFEVVAVIQAREVHGSTGDRIYVTFWSQNGGNS